jgi:acyl-CoA thioester hydrolase
LDFLGYGDATAASGVVFSALWLKTECSPMGSFGRPRLIADHAGAALAVDGRTDVEVFDLHIQGDEPSAGSAPHSRLAVQRPNESNPLGFCCDIVKPVFSGIVYHANYLRFMERGRTNHLRLMGAEQHALFAEAQQETPGFAFVVRSMQIDYLRPARMDDVLDIVTWPIAVKGASIMLAQEVRRGTDVLVKAQVRVAFICEGKAQPIPKALRLLLKADVI